MGKTTNAVSKMTPGKKNFIGTETLVKYTQAIKSIEIAMNPAIRPSPDANALCASNPRRARVRLTKMILAVTASLGPVKSLMFSVCF